jgi:hypothetical protein
VDAIKQPGVLVAASLSWPLSARLAARLVHFGCRVSAICPKGHVLREVSGLEAVFSYRPLGSLASLEAALERAAPDFVFPCDDRVVAQLHELHDSRPGLRPLIERSLGPAAEYPVVDSRARLLARAGDLEIRVPKTQEVDSEDAVRAWFQAEPSAAVLKRDGTWGGDGVEVVRSERDAIAAYRKLARRPRVGFALKRLLVNRDPLSLWAWRRRVAPTISIQRFIAGRPANAMLACWRGELLGIVTVEVLTSQGATGAGIVVRVVENEEIARAARLLSKRMSLTGFVGLDFMIDEVTGASSLIEMNPRCTQLGHLCLPRKGELVGMFYAKMSGRPAPQPEFPIEHDVISFFPQALLCNPRGPATHGSHLDVPWDDSRLIRELLRPPWPERQWLARLYHFLHAPPEVATTEFEGIPPSRSLRSSGTDSL